MKNIMIALTAIGAVVGIIYLVLRNSKNEE